MVVNVQSKFSKIDIQRMMGQKVARIEQTILNVLIRVGEDFVTEARNLDTYSDQTSNLRSSIGFVVLKNGRQIVGNFQTAIKKRYGGAAESKKGKYGGRGSGSEGVEAAEAFVSDIKSQYSKGYVLIVVAGMDYAASVESKGYDVITGPSLTAETALKSGLFNLSKKISAMAA